MHFLETPRFPGCPSFGYTSEPMYRVTVVATTGGYERRNRHWTYPLHRFTMTVGPRLQAEIAELLEFWHAVGGRAYGFRFHDYVDFKSCQIQDTPTSIDQPLVISPAASSGVYQMIKVYTAGVLSQVREITKPVAGTIMVADNGVLKTEGVDWTLDDTTGLVTINFSPAGALSWGGEFDVPVRFDSELPVEIVNKNIHSVQFLLMELRFTIDEALS